MSYYIFAYGTSPARLVDSQLVAAPWARATLGLTGTRTPTFEILRRTIHTIGKQGVRPLTPEEMAVMKNQAEVEAQVTKLCRATAVPPQAPEPMKSYYALWCATNGTIADKLRAIHENFFDWVGCK